MSKPKPMPSQKVANQLNASIFKLRRQEELLSKKLGVTRTEELRQFANKEMESRRENAFKQSMSWSDKELVWLWRVINHARDERVGAWCEAILGKSPHVELPFVAAPPQRKGRRSRANARLNQEIIDKIVSI